MHIESNAKAIVRERGAGESASGMELKVAGAETDNHYAIVEFPMKEGDPVTPMHIHRREDEALYLLSGELTIWVGTERLEAGPGAYVFLPRNIPHGFKVRRGTGEARILLMLSPGGTERFLVPAAGSEASDPADFGLEILDPVPEDEATMMV